MSELLFAIASLIQSCVLFVVLVMLLNVRRRYEQFRVEVAAMFRDTHELIQDINVRLTSAGYPPGRVYPRQPEDVQPARIANLPYVDNPRG